MVVQVGNVVVHRKTRGLSNLSSRLYNETSKSNDRRSWWISRILAFRAIKEKKLTLRSIFILVAKENSVARRDITFSKISRTEWRDLISVPIICYTRRETSYKESRDVTSRAELNMKSNREQTKRRDREFAVMKTLARFTTTGEENTILHGAEEQATNASKWHNLRKG